MQNNQPFTWGPEQRAAYQTLRDAMTEEGRVLRPIDRTRKLIMHTDWSVHGIGAVPRPKGRGWKRVSLCMYLPLA
jgi:hypothetical protein